MADEDSDADPADAPPATATAERVAAAERELDARGDRYARVTVVRREGPVSATVGDRAIVTADGDLVGWIGGVECAQSVVIREARRAMASGEATLIGLAPDPETIERPGMDAFRMTCHSGGTLELFLDPVVPAPRLVIAGGSAVAAALARFAAGMSYDVTVVDPEDEAPPGVDAVLATREPADIAPTIDERTYVVVATMGEFDRRALVPALEADATYIGLVASETRAADLYERVAETLDRSIEDVAAAVTNPAGVDVAARSPEEIAVSVLAELIDVTNSGARADADATAGDRAGPGAGAGGVMAEDPVCGMAVEPSGAPATVDHDGETYYFCCEGCADAFAADPEAYAE